MPKLPKMTNREKLHFTVGTIAVFGVVAIFYVLAHFVIKFW